MDKGGTQAVRGEGVTRRWGAGAVGVEVGCCVGPLKGGRGGEEAGEEKVILRGEISGLRRRGRGCMGGWTGIGTPTGRHQSRGWGSKEGKVRAKVFQSKRVADKGKQQGCWFELVVGKGG